MPVVPVHDFTYDVVNDLSLISLYVDKVSSPLQDLVPLLDFLKPCLEPIREWLVVSNQPLLSVDRIIVHLPLFC